MFGSCNFCFTWLKFLSICRLKFQMLSFRIVIFSQADDIYLFEKQELVSETLQVHVLQTSTKFPRVIFRKCDFIHDADDGMKLNIFIMAGFSVWWLANLTIKQGIQVFFPNPAALVIHKMIRSPSIMRTFVKRVD